MIISVKTGPKKKKKNKLVLKTLLTYWGDTIGATLLGRPTGIVNIKTGKYINRTYGTIESYYY
jgi:hypothetical protein